MTERRWPPVAVPRRWWTSRAVWSLLLGFAAATRGSSYLLTPAAGGDALTIIRSLASMHAWGWAFCVLAAACLAGVWSRWTAFLANGVAGVFLNAALATGLAWQAIAVHTSWSTVGQLALVAALHGVLGVVVLEGPPRLRWPIWRGR